MNNNWFTESVLCVIRLHNWEHNLGLQHSRPISSGQALASIQVKQIDMGTAWACTHMWAVHLHLLFYVNMRAHTHTTPTSVHAWWRAPTTSKVVTPITLRLSYTPMAFRVSAAMGTVEFTGLEMMFKIAWAWPHAHTAGAMSGRHASTAGVAGSTGACLEYGLHMGQRGTSAVQVTPLLGHHLPSMKWKVLYLPAAQCQVRSMESARVEPD